MWFLQFIYPNNEKYKPSVNTKFAQIGLIRINKNLYDEC